MSQKLVEQAKGKELGYRIIAVNKAGEGKPFNTEMVVLARTRWQLRRAVKLVMQTLSELKVEPHPRPRVSGVLLLRIRHRLCGHRGDRSADA